MTTEELIIFYKELANNIQNKKLSIKQLITAGEMQRAYYCKDKLDSGIVLDDKEIETYLFTGWYIYNQMRK